MSLRTAALAVAGLAATYAAVSRLITWRLGQPTQIGEVVIAPMRDDTTVDEGGACRSVQSADMRMPAAAIDAIWSPLHLERLARTYWRFMSRCTLGLIRVAYDDQARYVVFVRRPFVLIAFRSPEYEMDATRGVVRWRIERGVLVAPTGLDADGYLEIDVRRTPADEPGCVNLHVEVEVANYYPRIATAFTQWAYAVTQSRIHVIVTYGFLRSIARLNLSPSRVGRFAATAAGTAIEDVPNPDGPLPSERSEALNTRSGSLT